MSYVFDCKICRKGGQVTANLFVSEPVATRSSHQPAALIVVRKNAAILDAAAGGADASFANRDTN